MAKHTFRFDILEAGCLQCGQPAEHYMHWTEGEDKVMDVVEELQAHHDSMYTGGSLKPAIARAIKELKESRAKIPSDWHVSPRWIGVATVSTHMLKRFLKLPPEHYVERIWQNGDEGYGGNFKVVIVGPKCPCTLYGEKIPEVLITLHTDEKYCTIEKAGL